MIGVKENESGLEYEKDKGEQLLYFKYDKQK